MSDCLDENALSRYARTGLAQGERRAVDEHLDGCAGCRATLAKLVRQDNVADAGEGPTLVESKLIETVPRLVVPPVLLDRESTSAGPARYQLGSLLGIGGMGEVYEVRDGDLNRPVALKRLRSALRDSTNLARFIQEAQLTAQLEHPNIVPVHELGVLPSGEPFYTMKRVRGQDLQAVLRQLAEGDAAARERFSPMRLAIVFLQLLQAVAYAHARGVLHGDLKPANVLLGDYGEVLVTDWGLASVKEPAGPLESVTLTRPELRATNVGGTPRYMAPELRGGQPPDVRTEVYALGVILYEMLALSGPGEPLVPPSAKQRDVPPDLEEICLKALHVEPAERYPSAEALRLAVEDHLTGARRLLLAKQRHAEAERHLGQYRASLAARGELELRHTRLGAHLKPSDGAEQKRALWQVEEALEAQAHEADEQLAGALEGWARALGADPGFTAASDRLADLHLEQFLEAEDRGDRRAALYHRRHVERHHRGRHSAVLEGGGRVRIDPTRPGVRFEGWRLVERGKLIERGELLAAAAQGAVDVTLPMGSYVFVARAEGARPTVLPVSVGRGTEVSLAPRLFADAAIGEGFVHVPAGPFVYGGDPTALNSAPRQTLTLEDFFIARFPVTCEEYLEFLNARGAAARAHVPRTKPDGGYLWEPDASGRYLLPRFDGGEVRLLVEQRKHVVQANQHVAREEAADSGSDVLRRDVVEGAVALARRGPGRSGEHVALNELVDVGQADAVGDGELDRRRLPGGPLAIPGQGESPQALARGELGRTEQDVAVAHALLAGEVGRVVALELTHRLGVGAGAGIEVLRGDLPGVGLAVEANQRGVVRLGKRFGRQPTKAHLRQRAEPAVEQEALWVARPVQDLGGVPSRQPGQAVLGGLDEERAEVLAGAVAADGEQRLQGAGQRLGDFVERQGPSSDVLVDGVHHLGERRRQVRDVSQREDAVGIALRPLQQGELIEEPAHQRSRPLGQRATEGGRRESQLEGPAQLGLRRLDLLGSHRRATNLHRQPA